MGLMDTYHYVFHELGDWRVGGWPLMDNPIPMLTITACYLYFVLVWGPKFMKNRKAYNLLLFTKVYNVFQILANAGIIYSLYSAGWFSAYGLICHVRGYGTDPLAMRIAHVMWWLTVLKLVDYTETCVFILRKKQKQVSFLHLYHHVSTVLLCWCVTKYYALGVTMFLTICNCAVHVVMYTYYFLSTLGPEIKKKIVPFKKTVTTIQLVQFVILLLYSLQTYLPYCDVTSNLRYMLHLNLTINLLLFSNFYVKTYVKPKKI